MEQERAGALDQVSPPRMLEAYLSDPVDAATHCLKTASPVAWMLQDKTWVIIKHAIVVVRTGVREQICSV